MPQFRGTKNLHLGSPAWAESKYDPDNRQYVITLDDDKAQDFRKVAAGYGFTEIPEPVGEPVEEPEPDEPSEADEDAEDEDDEEPVE